MATLPGPLATLLPPLLLATVAAVHLHHARHDRLATWKGGGFAMFASLDSASLRRLRATASINGRTLEVPIWDAADLAEVAARVSTLPGAQGLQQLARAVHQRPWAIAPSPAPAGRPGDRLIPAAPGQTPVLPLERTEVTLWQTRLDHQGRLRAELLGNASWPDGSAGAADPGAPR
jgi:hypothetical protein